MAKEILAVPEDNLLEVIRVIRLGLKAAKTGVSKEAREMLTIWCDEEEEYITAPEEPLDPEEQQRMDEEDARLRSECVCGHSLVQHKDRRPGGKCWACKCKGFKEKSTAKAAPKKR